jgi:hypothetical protein
MTRKRKNQVWEPFLVPRFCAKGLTMPRNLALSRDWKTNKRSKPISLGSARRATTSVPRAPRVVQVGSTGCIYLLVGCCQLCRKSTKRVPVREAGVFGILHFRPVSASSPFLSRLELSFHLQLTIH